MEAFTSISSQAASASTSFLPRVSSGTVRKYQTKIVVIGDSSVGKTSLIQMFEHARFTEHFKPTIGADFSNKEI